jgi:hypothetical protein
VPDDPRTPDPGVSEPERGLHEPEPNGVSEPPSGAPVDDEFANVVLDDSFVRGGSYEPPARTRVAIARYGGQQTSWRHGGGLAAGDEAEAEAAPARKPRRRSRSTSGRAPRAAASRSVTAPTPLMEKLPIIVAAVVVAVFAFLMFS